MTPVRLEHAASLSRVKHSTTEPLRSQGIYVLVHEIYTGMYRKSLLNTLMLTYPAGGLKFGLVIIYINILQCVRAAEKVW